MRTTKIFKKYIALILLCGWMSVGYAQIPSGNEGINYQAIARDGAGDVMVSTALTVTVDIKIGDPIPVSEYTETHAVVTNAYGQFSLVMGEGTPTLGTFGAIDWAAAKHWYGISIFDGSTTVVLPDMAFHSVPYAHGSSPHTMDQAYDEEGVGAGRTIEVDALAVTLEVDGGNDGMVIIPQIDGLGTPLDAGLVVEDDVLGTSATGVLVEYDGTSSGDAFYAYMGASGSGKGLQVDQDGSGDAVEINNTDGIGLEINNSGDDNSMVINHTDATSVVEGIELNYAGTNDALEINHSDGIGFEINNSGVLESVKVLHTLATSVKPAVVIDNAGLDKALVISQPNPLAVAPALVVDNTGLVEGVKVTQLGPGAGVHIDNMFGSTGLHVANTAPPGSTGISVTTSAGDGVTVITDQTMSAIGKVLGGGADASAASFLTVPNMAGPDATEPTLIASNMVGGITAAFGNTPASALPTVAIGNSGTGNALTITSTDHTTHALSVESEVGGHTEGAAKFFNTDPFSLADNVVEMSSAETGFPGHAVLEVFPAAVTDQAANFEGKVDITGDLIAGGAVTVTVGDLDVTAGSVTIGDDCIVGDGLSAIDGFFFGDLTIVGTLAKGAGTFKIDHPMDPENKYLYHSFVESPDMMNIYNGNVSTDDKGFAIVELPGYFDVLNIDYRYQLTVIGSFAQAIVKEEVSENTFVIQTNKPNTKVSWMVTGVRNDDYARENRVKVEVEKEAEAKGTRLYTPIHP